MVKFMKISTTHALRRTRKSQEQNMNKFLYTYNASQTVEQLTDQHSDNREVHFYLTCRVHYENIVYLYVTRGDPSIVANFERVPQTIGCLADLLPNRRNDLKGNSIEKIFSNLVQRGLSHGAVHCKSLFELFLKLFEI